SNNFYDYTDNDPVNFSDPSGLRKAQVCCRPLKGAKGKIWNHCYIQFLDDSGKVTASYGVLGNEGSSANQIPRKNDHRNTGGNCKDIKGNNCQLDKLENGLQNSVDAETCPSCGDNYKAWIATDLLHMFDGYNSNTYVWNMVEGAGIKPPKER